MLNTNSKIYIAGHHGLVGSAIWNNLKARGYDNLVGRSHSELDLTDQYAVKKFFDENLLLKCASMFYIIIFVVMSRILLAMKNKNGTCKKIKGLRSLM